MTFRLVINPNVQANISHIYRWWRANRPENPSLFRQELTSARKLLAERPEVGVEVPERPGIRKLLLLRTQYHVYYLIDREARAVCIVAIWHNARGSGPPL